MENMTTRQLFARFTRHFFTTNDTYTIRFIDFVLRRVRKPTRKQDIYIYAYHMMIQKHPRIVYNECECVYCAVVPFVHIGRDTTVTKIRHNATLQVLMIDNVCMLFSP
jgi:hypothetical protein